MSRNITPELLSALSCPKCGADLRPNEGKEELLCKNCGQSFHIENNIPQLFWPHGDTNVEGDVTESIKAFYEKNPFPNYDSFDNVASLINKAREGVFARLLDEQIPTNAKILEAGCGTGQLSSFLSIANRTVYGTDICLNSLRLAENFRSKNDLKHLYFLQMNLFRPSFKTESFDLVISNGVLHHTSDPRGGFDTLAKLVKPGRYLLVGLYHKYGRLITDVRRKIFSAFGESLYFLDPQLRKVRSGTDKWRAWYMDQYKNPHESKHTIADTIRWFAEDGFDVVKTIPKTKLFAPFSDNEQLFVKDVIASSGELFLKELSMIPSGSREGGFFIVIGKKHF